MKATGMVRQLDELGRIVIPMEIRRTMDLPPKSALEIFTDDNKIVLRSYKPGCTICGNVNPPYKAFKGAALCGDCMDELKKG